MGSLGHALREVKMHPLPSLENLKICSSYFDDALAVCMKVTHISLIVYAWYRIVIPL